MRKFIIVTATEYGVDHVDSACDTAEEAADKMLEDFIDTYMDFVGDELWQLFAEENNIDLSDLNEDFSAEDFLQKVREANKINDLRNYINETDGMHCYSSEIKATTDASCSEPYPFIETSFHGIDV